MLYRIRMYDTCVTPWSERSFICSSVAPINRKPEAYRSCNHIRFDAVTYQSDLRMVASIGNCLVPSSC